MAEPPTDTGQTTTNPIHRVTSVLRGLESTAINAAELVRYGGFEISHESSPWHTVSSHRVYKLRRYFPDDLPADAPVIMLVPPLMMTAEMWDIDPPRTGAAGVSTRSSRWARRQTLGRPCPSRSHRSEPPSSRTCSSNWGSWTDCPSLAG